MDSTKVGIDGHKPYCKCLRCKVGILDRGALLKIPLTGECQCCHKVIQDVVAGVPCKDCNFGGIDVKVAG